MRDIFMSLIVDGADAPFETILPQRPDGRNGELTASKVGALLDQFPQDAGDDATVTIRWQSITATYRYATEDDRA